MGGCGVRLAGGAGKPQVIPPSPSGPGVTGEVRLLFLGGKASGQSCRSAVTECHLLLPCFKENGIPNEDVVPSQRHRQKAVLGASKRRTIPCGRAQADSARLVRLLSRLSFLLPEVSLPRAHGHGARGRRCRVRAAFLTWVSPACRSAVLCFPQGLSFF